MSKKSGANFSKPSKVFDKVAAYYNDPEKGFDLNPPLTSKQAESLVAYHSQLRSELNQEFNAAATGNHFETEKSPWTKFISAISGIVSAVVPFGNAAQVISTGVSAADSHFHRKELANFANLMPAFDQDVNTFTKTLATKIIEGEVDKIRGLDPSQAKEAAKKDFEILRSQVSKGKFKDSDSISQGSADAMLDPSSKEVSSLESLAEEMANSLLEAKEKLSEQGNNNSGHQYHSLLGAHKEAQNASREEEEKKGKNSFRDLARSALVKPDPDEAHQNNGECAATPHKTGASR